MPRPRPCENRRRGAAILEVAIVLSLLILLILGVIDLGFGVFRQHVLSQSARQLARHVIVRGELSERMPVLGPVAVSTSGSASNPITDFIAPKLIGWDLADVDIEVAWIDGGNDVRNGDRVRVAISAPYRPIMVHLFTQASIPLSATSTMSLAH